MVKQLVNHPSLAIWNLGSEPFPENHRKLCRALADEVIALDPTRAVQVGNGSGLFDPIRWRDDFGWDIDFHFYCGFWTTEDAPPNDLDPTKTWWGDTVFDLSRKHPALFELVTEFGALVSKIVRNLPVSSRKMLLAGHLTGRFSANMACGMRCCCGG